MLRLQRAGRHDGGNRAAEAENHGQKRLAGKSHTPHDAIHHIGHPGHIAAVLQNGKSQKQDENIGDKGQDAAHTGYDTVHHQGNHPVRRMDGRKAGTHQIGNDGKGVLQTALQEIADGKGQEKHQRHDAQKHRDAPDRMGQDPVDFVRSRCLFRLVEQRLIDYRFDIFVFFLRDLLLVAAVRHTLQLDGMILLHLRIVLQQLDRVPAQGGMVRIAVLHPLFQNRKPVFDFFPVIQDILLRTFLIMMNHRMHQNVEPGPLCRGYRNHRNPSQHLRQAVQVDLHPPLLHDVHHIERQDDRLSQLQKLERQIQVSLQAGSVHHVDDRFDIIVQDAFSGHHLFYGIAGQRIDAGRVHQFQLIPFVSDISFVFFHRHAGPVGHLQL